MIDSRRLDPFALQGLDVVQVGQLTIGGVGHDLASELIADVRLADDQDPLGLNEVGPSYRRAGLSESGPIAQNPAPCDSPEKRTCPLMGENSVFVTSTHRPSLVFGKGRESVEVILSITPDTFGLLDRFRALEFSACSCD